MTAAARCTARLLVAGAAFALAGCASMSPSDCLTANWGDQGYKDARMGLAPTRIMEHRKACAEVGVIPDTAFYRQGWDQGVLEYCTPANAVTQGRAGRPYRSICPPQLEGPFVYWHQLGMNVYQAQRRVDDLDRQLTQTRRQIDKEDDAKKRRALRHRLDRLGRDLSDARHDLARAERHLR